MSEIKKLIISIAVVVLALGGVGAWLGMGLKKTEALDKSLVDKRSNLSDLQAKVAAIPALKQEQQTLAGELQEYETILPNDRELNKIFDTLSDYEKKAGVELTQFTPMRDERATKTTAETSYKRVSYELDMAGDYFAVVKFLNLLENHNRFVRVDSFSVKQKDEDDPINEVNLKLSTFVYDPKAKVVRKTAARRRGPAKPGAAEPEPVAKQAPDVPFDLKYELASRYEFKGEDGLRDPFTNPLTRRIAVQFRPQDATRRLTASQQVTVTETIEENLNKVSLMIEKGEAEQAEKLLAETQSLMTADFTDKECAKKQLGLSRHAQRLGIMVRAARGERLYQIVQGYHADMLKAFNSGDYDEVYKANLAVKEAINQAGPDLLHDRLSELSDACKMLCRRTDARREFANVVVDIQGTFWTGRGAKRRAAAIINNQTVSEGDRLRMDAVKTKGAVAKGGLKIDEEIIVRKIGRDKVTFFYKDEEIDKYQFETE